MNVSAIIVTRGNVDLVPILASLPNEWERVIWDNGRGRCDTWSPQARIVADAPKTFTIADLAVYGRYAAIKYATHNLIYVQDDDCIISEPDAIAAEWLRKARNGYFGPGAHYPDPIPFDALEPFVVCNMPERFRHDFYSDHALVGFGAVFHRDAPQRVFERFADAHGATPVDLLERLAINGRLSRTCDIVFTGLASRVLVDVPYEDLPWAHADDRMWKQATHVAERTHMLDLMRKARDAG